jgi:hypothetical protein
MEIPKAVKGIKDSAFSFCLGLTTVTLGDGLEEIGETSFWDRVSLEHIVIPDAIKIIKYHEFN